MGQPPPAPRLPALRFLPPPHVTLTGLSASRPTHPWGRPTSRPTFCPSGGRWSEPRLRVSFRRCGVFSGEGWSAARRRPTDVGGTPCPMGGAGPYGEKLCPMGGAVALGWLWGGVWGKWKRNLHGGFCSGEGNALWGTMGSCGAQWGAVGSARTPHPRGSMGHSWGPSVASQGSLGLGFGTSVWGLGPRFEIWDPDSGFGTGLWELILGSAAGPGVRVRRGLWVRFGFGVRI